MNIDCPAIHHIPGLRDLWKRAFGDEDAFLDGFFGTAFSPDRCRMLTLKAEAAAALYWLDCRLGENRLAYLYAVATAPEFRGQGLCRALMEDTLRLLRERGYAGAVLVPGEPALFAMYEKMGYQVLSGMDILSCRAGQMPAALRRVDAGQYAAVRRRLLPPGGIVQEGENLRLLESYAELYAGEDFVLAAVKDGASLRGLELLGNPAAAPDILAALSMEQGRFRIPGSTPFAMYRPLTDAPSPRYFGLAFD